MKDNLKSKILSDLSQSGGQLLNGSQLAKRHNVSRNAVWKVMKELQKEGLIIESRLSGGYTFLGDGDVLSSEIISASLTTKHLGRQLEILKSVDSTNLYVKRNAANAEGYTVVSEYQTGGQGRRSRLFYSPSGGVYFSVLLKPNIAPEDVQFLTVCAALAVCTAIEQVCGFNAGIKWINDIFYQNKKLCGISTQASFSAEIMGMEYVVIGIGINTGDIADEVKDIAISTLQITGKRGFRNALIAAVLNRLEQVVHDFLNGGKGAVLAEYKKHLCMLGQAVDVVEAMGGSYTAVASDLTEDGELIVIDQEGNTRCLNTSEVSIRRAQNV